MNYDFEEDLQTVQSHMAIIQNVIQRMASNSSASKTWCITLVSAILVIIADKSNPSYAWITILPVALFLMLDAYYLALERGFRNSYNNFIERLHNNTLEQDDLFVVEPSGEMRNLFFDSMFSISVLPFYGAMIAMIVIIRYYIL